MGVLSHLRIGRCDVGEGVVALRPVSLISISTHRSPPKLSSLACRQNSTFLLFVPSPFDFANAIISYPIMRQRPRHHAHITMERHNIPPLVVFRWNLAFEDNMLRTVCHALRVAVCPHTRSDDLMILV